MFTDQPSPLPPNDLAYTVALYDGGIAYVDHWVGELVNELENLGLMDQATLVVLSDHGEEFQEHGSVGHEKLYPTITRVPLFIRPPGGTRQIRVQQVASLVDVMPTILALVGIEPPPGIDGRDLSPWLYERKVAPSAVFGESPFFGQRRFIAAGDYQLLMAEENAKVELFQFREDEHALTNLATVDVERTTRLQTAVLEWRRRTEDGPGSHAERSDINQEVREQLEALGYVQ
jgi:arylsulfatase A-like enzyme